jgi:hypothetical protein
MIKSITTIPLNAFRISFSTVVVYARAEEQLVNCVPSRQLGVLPWPQWRREMNPPPPPPRGDEFGRGDGYGVVVDLHRATVAAWEWATPHMGAAGVGVGARSSSVLENHDGRL